MEAFKKSVLKGLDNIFIYLGLYGYKLLEENESFYLEKNGQKEPIQFFLEADGRIEELYCDINDERVYFKKEKESQSFGIKKDGKQITGVTLTNSGEFSLFVNGLDKQSTLFLSESSLAFSYDEPGLHVGARIFISGRSVKNTIRFLDMIAKVKEQFVFASVEKTKKTNHLIFRGEISRGMEFEPLVKVKKRCKKDELPAYWVDVVLFPENEISYFGKAMEEIEKCYPGFTSYMQQYHATFANVYPQSRDDVKRSSLSEAWPYVMDNIREKLFDPKEAKSRFVPRLSPSTEKC